MDLVQQGDLLFWSEDGGESYYHATVISKGTANEIRFTGHTSPRFDQKLSEALEEDEVAIVVLNDYLHGGDYYD